PNRVPPAKTKDRNVEANCVAFGQRLARAMRDAELTQAEVSRLMGVSRSAVNWWVKGITYPSIENAERLADLLRVTPEFLLFGVVKVVKDRLVESIPVADSKIHAGQRMTQIGVPKDFLQRTAPNVGHLK